MSPPYPTFNGEEGEDRKPDMTLRQLYELLLEALALGNRAEFDKLSQAYLIGNRGAYSRRAH